MGGNKIKIEAMRRTDGFDIYRKGRRDVVVASQEPFSPTSTTCSIEQGEDKSVDLTLAIICVFLAQWETYSCNGQIAACVCFFLTFYWTFIGVVFGWCSVPSFHLD